MPRSPASVALSPGAAVKPASPRSSRSPRAGGTPRAAAVASPATPSGTSTQRIVDAITAAIVERRLMPGTKLVESQIGEVFRVSRTVVRQALNQLSRDHLVRLEPARGAFVAQPGVEESRQVFEVRRLLEVGLVRELCGRITDEQIRILRAHLQHEQAAVQRTDVAGRTRLLADFHVLLARQLGNEVLAQLLGDLLSRCSLIALMYQSAHSAEHSAAGHVAIVDALERRDVRAVTRLMGAHLEDVERHLRLHPRVSDLGAALAPGTANV